MIDSTSLREAGGDPLGALVTNKSGEVVQATAVENGTADVDVKVAPAAPKWPPRIGIAPGAPARKVGPSGRATSFTAVGDTPDSLMLEIGQHAISGAYTDERGPSAGTPAEPDDEEKV